MVHLENDAGEEVGASIPSCLHTIALLHSMCRGAGQSGVSQGSRFLSHGRLEAAGVGVQEFLGRDLIGSQPCPPLPAVELDVQAPARMNMRDCPCLLTRSHLCLDPVAHGEPSGRGCGGGRGPGRGVGDRNRNCSTSSSRSCRLGPHDLPTSSAVPGWDTGSRLWALFLLLLRLLPLCPALASSCPRCAGRALAGLVLSTTMHTLV
mmetsp:Transcript_746/g.2392  ORF Transcript_746/g.2392 Transcript_746/m.2392 type:complete len:206 (-) Transcript_746:271-888(-)